jgi:hypothetical protein
MRGMTEFIEEHNARLKTAVFDRDFLSFHLEQIGFLQHERMAHLFVMLFVIFGFLVFFVLYFIYATVYFLSLFVIALVLTVFYVFHYFKLENTVIAWYFIYNDKSQKGSAP